MGPVRSDSPFNLLRQGSTAAEPEVKVALTRLAEEARERNIRGTHASGDFFISTMHAVSSLRGSSNSELRMSCLYDCAAYFFHKGQSERALLAVRELTRLAAVVRGDIWLGKANTIAGVVHADIGNIGEAFAHHAAALQVYRRHGDAISEAKVLMNLGVALNYGGLYREAIPCFMSVASAAGRIDVRSELAAVASVNLAQSYFYLGEFDKGFSAARKSLELSAPPTNAECTCRSPYASLRSFSLHWSLVRTTWRLSIARDAENTRCLQGQGHGKPWPGSLVASVKFIWET